MPVSLIILIAALSVFGGAALPNSPSPTVDDVGGGIPTVTASVDDVGGGIPTH